MTQSTRRTFSARRIAGLIRKEGRQVLRDPSNFVVAIILPALLLFLFGYGVSFDPRHYDVGLVIEQPTPETGSFAASLNNSPFFDVETTHDRRFLERKLVSGDLHAIVVLPANFAEEAYRRHSAPLQLIVDGADPNTANLVEGYIEFLWINWIEQERISRGDTIASLPISVEHRVWFNAELASRNYLVPGSIAIILTLIGSLLTALVIAREWERGTMEALLATPINVAELLIGKLTPYFFLGMGSMGLSSLLAVIVFDVPLRGSLIVLIAISAIFMLTSLGQGLLISTLTRNQLVAAQISILSSFLPAFYFSNFVFELESMPMALQWISYAVPARYFVASLQSVFLAGDVPSIVLFNAAALAAIAATFFTITLLRTRTRLD
ncbi:MULTISPECIES: ABC transporter permease [Alphaproteobacteria]|jgi:ABC-2 type transport system permease protein|uniref:Membrane protein n=2 Tax=Bacteria TaxID=2 RepID=A0A9W6IQH5_9PROT|nr:ABC transporter permease [Maricaulis virginensis]GLK53495.1 membrane protein [Maricaulis virginensis]